VINYIFESPESLYEFLEFLRPLHPCIHCYWLTCDEEEQAKRVRNRKREDLPWELGRFLELRRIQKEASKDGFIGKEVDTTRMTAGEAAQTIWNDIFPHRLPSQLTPKRRQARFRERRRSAVVILKLESYSLLYSRISPG
jgi:hypothetical protein